MKNKITLAKQSLYFLSGTLAIWAVVCMLANVLVARLQFLSVDPVRLQQLTLLASLGLVIAAVLIFSLGRLLPFFKTQSITEKIPSEVTHPSSKVWTWACFALCLVILAQSVVKINSPLDWDELDTATRLATPSVCPMDDHDPYRNRDLISPTKNTRNHTIANIAILTAYRIFGISEKVARYPSLLFTALLLAALIGLSKGFYPRVAVAFVLLHLAFNGMFRWYSHSLRGYASMELFTFLALLEVLRTNHKRSSPWLYAGFVLVASVTHTFGALFCLLLFCSHFIWVAWQAPNLGTPELQFHLSRIKTSFLAAPVIGFVLVKQFLFLNQIGYLNATAPVEKAEAWLAALGITAPANLWVLLAILCVLATKIIVKRKIDLLGMHLLVSAIFLTALVTLLKATLFEARFLLAFLIPTLLWIGTTIAETPGPLVRRTLWTIATVTFLALPFLGNSQTYQRRTQLMGGFGNFMSKVREIVPRTEANCIDFAGEPDQVMFSRGLFYPKAHSEAICTSQYQASFTKSWKGDTQSQMEKASDWKVLLDDHEGRILGKGIKTNSPLALGKP